MTYIEYAIGRIQTEIIDDVIHGPGPKTIMAFSDLHDYVDANEYGGFSDSVNNAYWWPEGGCTTRKGYQVSMRLDEIAAVQDSIDVWLTTCGKFNPRFGCL